MKNQKQFVIDELKRNHKISRNYCLQNFVSRLGALILILKKEGWLFESEYENGDYIYRVVGEPSETMPISTQLLEPQKLVNRLYNERIDSLEKQQEPLFSMRVPLN